MGAESLLKNNFEDYLKNEDDIKLRFQIPENIEDLNNIIIYGPEGTGKYTKSLKIIKKYSPSLLKYNKKILIPNNKNDYYIKISDIHYEVDMKLLGCNSKTLWNDIYTNIVDIVNREFLLEEHIEYIKKFNKIDFDNLKYISFIAFAQNCIIIKKMTQERYEKYGKRKYRFANAL